MSNTFANFDFRRIDLKIKIYLPIKSIGYNCKNTDCNLVYTFGEGIVKHNKL